MFNKKNINIKFDILLHMGKKSNKRKGSNESMLPNVSICTPTFNRRPFFKGLIECIKAQDYPHEKIEWIIVDDGTDCIQDIFDDKEMIKSLNGIQVRYVYENKKMDLGKKRNLMHKKCEYKNDNDIIVYMDDDDYYPPERVSHSVKKLCSNPKVLCGGSSELYLWFNVLDKMYKFGPYGPNHATAGTFAFKRKLLKQTSYDDSAILAEEKHFLKNYTIPFIQFDPFKTILVVSHEQNTFDKKRLINKENKLCNESNIKVKQFIENTALRSFYKDEINVLLKSYEPGNIENKPRVLEEIKRKDNERQLMADNKPSGIFVSDKENNTKQLSVKEVKFFLDHKSKENNFLKEKIKVLMNEINVLKKKVEDLSSIEDIKESNTIITSIS